MNAVNPNIVFSFRRRILIFLPRELKRKYQGEMMGYNFILLSIPTYNMNIVICRLKHVLRWLFFIWIYVWE